MSNHDAYHAVDALSASKLKAMQEGWREFEVLYVTQTKPRKKTKSKQLGSISHTLLLEPQHFNRYAVMPAKTSEHIDTVDELKALCKSLNIATKSTWRKGDYITALIDADPSLQGELWVCFMEQWQADNRDKTIVTADEYAVASNVLDAVRKSKIAQQILGDGGLPEHALYWQDRDTGLDCKALYDLLQYRRVVDVKTARDARLAGFQRDAHKYGYFMQAAHYIDGAKHDGLDLESFVFIVVETAAPYRVRAYEYTPESLQWASEKRRELMAEYVRRKEANDWSEDKENEIQKIAIPPYAMGDNVDWDALNGGEE
jgi:hypothetical protein